MTAKKRLTRRPQHKPSSASRVPQPLTSDALVYTEYDITDEPLHNRAIKKLPAQVQRVLTTCTSWDSVILGRQSLR